MSTSRHVMILASAGSGKTYALTGRFIRLLAQGAKPERIVALTFTRKAAGEFFDEILKKLAEAAANEARAKILAAETGRPELGRADFLRMLREVTEAMPRLRLGTLDSFFARIARAFALELGLTGDFEILQEYAARLERRRVLQRMFTRAGELDAAQKEFIEAFKRATFGREIKRLGAQLDEFIDSHQEVFLAARDGARWGNPALIWPQGCQWLGGKADVTHAVRGLRTWLGEAGTEGKSLEKWIEFLDGIEAWSPGADTAELKYVLEKVLGVWTEIGAGRAELKFFKKPQQLSASACAALRECVRHVVGSELARRLETTRGIHAVLHGYETIYHETVRRAGKLTFADVQRLLAPGAGAPALTRGEEGDGRLFIDYRLDAEIDHWLLDEFQDTSYGQWSVLKNLIDEAVQDEAEVRSLFCVGDVKQAIYTWREGDPRLFREILNYYNEAKPENIAEEHLVESRRSGPALIEMVNAVFGDAAVLQDLFPGEIATNWNREWRPHTTAVPERTGQAAWLHAVDEAGRWAVVLELLREIRPLERGLTCAVLVQSNTTAAELAEYLRREAGLSAVAEADLRVCTDNPLGQALLALVQAAAHPGDTLAQEHLRMTPLGPVLSAEGLGAPEMLAEQVLGQIHADGFEHTMERWAAKAVSLLVPDDIFSRTRARQFVAAARLFDETGRRNAAEFVAFMERHTVRENEGAAIIRVMTIHKSKGLGFDVVLLPDVEGKKLDQARDGLAVHKSPDRSIEWVLDLPPKSFCAADAVLAAHVGAAEAEAGYEALSLLYVAMTRAKRAIYVIAAPSGDSVSRNYRRLLTETLGDNVSEVRVGALKSKGGWMAGDADWHTKVTVPVAAVRAKPEIARLNGIESRPARLVARRASGEKQERKNAAGLFSLAAAAGAEFGSAVHHLFSEVEWDGTAQLAEWKSRGLADEVLSEVAGCLQAPELKTVWIKPANDGKVDLWRERSFEIVLDNSWVTGVFDRVVVVYDAAGQPKGATVFDFKTDRFPEEQRVTAVARHRAQLNLYRRVVAVLTGLNEGSVAGELVFTFHQHRVPVPIGIA